MEELHAMPYTATISLSVPLAREPTGPGLLTPADVAKQCTDMRDLGQEIFAVFTLDQKHAILDRHIISVGTLTESLVHPRDVFRPAIADNAAAVAVIVVHNHPSGSPEPSRADEILTERLSAAAEVLGIRLLEHLIIGRSAWVSVVHRERGTLS
jgi:DNA repair protein RadC